MRPDGQGRPNDNGFFERDVEYFRDAQYATTSNLNARVALHARYSTATQEWFDWLADQCEWSISRDVLEVGCGTGLFWRHIPQAVGGHVVLTMTDLSEVMVETAVAFARTFAHDVRGLTTDVRNLPFDDASFDLVFANHMLYHLADPSTAISEIARVLRPNGTLVASTNGPGHLRELYAIDTAVFGASDVRNNNARVFGAVSGVPLLEQSFGEVEWRSHVDRLLCTEPDDIVAYLTSVPPGEGASPSQLAQLRTEVRRRVVDGGGVLVVSKEAGAFIAREPSPARST
jgi:SAM-dependent methyltransferase